jgi:hypothetical protein
MRIASKSPSADNIDTRPTSQATSLPGQVVLVLQGGGALGAYQAGVYQALHEAGIEPDWIIGTSIGAINASLIAGNEAPNRLPRLEEFWGPHGRQGLLACVGGLGAGGPALVLLEGLELRRSRLLRAQSAGFPGTPHAVGRRSRGLLLDGCQNPQTASSLGLPAKDQRLLRRSRSAHSRSAREAPPSVAKAAY